MWMSSMTSGVKILLRPRTVRLEGAVSSATGRLLEHELALGRLEGVVVVELAAAYELLQFGRRAQVVQAELALDELGVGVRPLAGHAVDAERPDLACDVDGPVVHRVAQPRADAAAEDLPTPLHHEAGHGRRVPEDDDGAALLVDAGARADPTLDHDVATAQRRRGQRSRVAVDHDDPRHHVLAGRPSDAPGDVDLGAVDQSAPEVAEAPLEGDPAARKDAGPE